MMYYFSYFHNFNFSVRSFQPSRTHTCLTLLWLQQQQTVIFCVPKIITMQTRSLVTLHTEHTPKSCCLWHCSHVDSWFDI